MNNRKRSFGVSFEFSSAPSFTNNHLFIYLLTAAYKALSFSLFPSFFHTLLLVSLCLCPGILLSHSRMNRFMIFAPPAVAPYIPIDQYQPKIAS